MEIGSTTFNASRTEIPMHVRVRVRGIRLLRLRLALVVVLLYLVRWVSGRGLTHEVYPD